MLVHWLRQLRRRLRPARSRSARPRTAAGPILSLDEIARALAGLPVAGPAAAALGATPALREHAALMQRDYELLEAKRLGPMRAWSSSELAEINAVTRTLFYVFGGPDVATALALFPTTTTYVLIGLEPAGTPPCLAALDPEPLATYLADLRHSLRDFFSVSYFKTIGMEATLPGGQVNGALPLLLALLARAGCAVHGLTPVTFSPGGALVTLGGFPRDRGPTDPYGVRIDASLRDEPRAVFYFTQDLRDRTFTPESGSYRFYESLGFQTSFIKSASYLLHFREFGHARHLVLSRSRYLLQDDTGVPYRYLKGAWNIKLYGQLQDPVEAFSQVRGAVAQPQLAARYARPGEVTPMPFHMGYHWRSQRDAWMRCERIAHRDGPAGTPGP